MIIDTHIHITNEQTPNPESLLASMDMHGIERAALFSEEPAYYETDPVLRAEHNGRRLGRLLQWCQKSSGRLIPISFINPTEPDAVQQVDEALQAGVVGFKVICETFYPGDERAMPVYRHIAAKGKSILFHSGILWDPGPCSRFNRPALFEALMDVPNLTFALAHIGWPWTDELIAVYGKLMALRNHPKFTGQRMYIDMTPGTPDCYRLEVIKRILDVGYPEMSSRLLFGSDSFTGEFDGQYAADIWASDRLIFDELGLSSEDLNDISHNNALSFWDIA